MLVCFQVAASKDTGYEFFEQMLENVSITAMYFALEIYSVSIANVADG